MRADIYTGLINLSSNSGKDTALVKATAKLIFAEYDDDDFVVGAESGEGEDYFISLCCYEWQFSVSELRDIYNTAKKAAKS